MKPNILCIEDHPDNMMLIRHIFRPDGYNLIEAKNGVQGLSIGLYQESLPATPNEQRYPWMTSRKNKDKLTKWIYSRN